MLLLLLLFLIKLREDRQRRQQPTTMDLLKKEMERKKRMVAKAKAEKSQQIGKRKYLKASELQRFQEQQEEQERREKEQKREQYPNKKQKLIDPSSSEQQEQKRKKKKKKEDVNDSVVQETTASASAAAARLSESSSSSSKKEFSLTEITNGLRGMGLPVRLFGETNDARVQRLREALDQQSSVSKTQSEMDEFRLGKGHGIRNTFLERRRQQQEQQQQQDKEALGDTTRAKSPPPTSATKTSETKAKNDDQNTKQDDDDDDNNKKAALDDSDPHKLIYKYFKGLLKEWEEELANRPESVQNSAVGKNETKILKQCKDYIRPLFRLCKTRRLEEGLLRHIVRIVKACQAEEFVEAHDAYGDMAIGRAAWPIGVTMVGIHARSGRAKIESSKVAHVMNSELQRKYLTSVKRLMSYAQRKSNAAPSKKVLNL